MKYANRLSDEELRELYLMFIDEGATIIELNITRDDYEISLEGVFAVPEWDEELLKEDSNSVVYINDDYSIFDFHVRVYDHSGDCTKDYREFMYKKFGDEYARDFMFGITDKEKDQ